MPFTLEIILKDGSKESWQLPVETSLQGYLHTVHFSTTQQVKSVIIDPENLLPDSDRTNNVWKE